MVETYLAAAVWLFFVDVGHRYIAGEPLRLLLAALYAAAWPLSIAYFSWDRALAKRSRTVRLGNRKQGG